jgi:hypothetical protein
MVVAQAVLTHFPATGLAAPAGDAPTRVHRRTRLPGCCFVWIGAARDGTVAAGERPQACRPGRIISRTLCSPVEIEQFPNEVASQWNRCTSPT